MKKFAYYLPQYHTIPENDEWWGKGFTEWTNVKKAKPLFRGHQQPVHPLDGNYYILDNPNVLKWQAQLALKYGIDGMIFYHYYFCGKKLLEKPAEILLNNTDIPMHFFFCWANHDWYRSWEGSKALLMQQKYGGIEEWENHFQYLLPFFKDERYEKKDNKPIFMLYKCEFNEKYEMISYFNKRCIESGFDGISVIETFNHDAGERKDTFDTLLSGFMNKVSSSTDYIHLRQPTEVLNWYRTLPEYSFSRIWNKLGRISRVFGTHFIEKYDGTRLFKVMTRYHVHKSGMGYLISLGIYSFKGVKVGLDCANGSSWNIAKSVFDALGADTYVINNKPNGLNINNNAGSTHIEGLQKFVVEKGLDIGFAFDGDADRCLCVDEKGNVITGDHILYIYGCYMKERGKLLNNTVVTTVMSNFGLYKAFDEQGIGYAKTAVGDKYVYEYMAKNGCRIGGEQSGHIIFSKYASTGDGILTSLKMMEAMLAKKKPMSELAAALKIYPQVLENVRVTDKKAAQNDEAVQTAIKKVAEGLGDTGRILVRESGTEPVVRVMVEAPDHDTCQKYVSEVVDVIRDRGYSL